MSESIPKIHAVSNMALNESLFRVYVCLSFFFFFFCICILIVIVLCFCFLEEDRYDSYSRMILKYFLAEGVVCQHELFVSAAQDNPDDILQVWKGICCFAKSSIFFWPHHQQWCQDDLKMSTSTSSHSNICRRVNDIFEKRFATFHH